MLKGTASMATSSDLFDAGVRVEKIIYIPGAVADMEATPEVFRDFCEDLPDGIDSPLYEALPALKRFAGGDYPKPEEVAEALAYKEGFLVQAATPVRQYSDDPSDTSYSSLSWGHYYTAWLYASEEEEIAPVILAWAETRADYDKQRAVKR